MARPFTADQVAAVFRELLGSDDVRVDDDWFDIGGSSVAGLRLVARLNQAADVRLRLRDVVRAPTPEGLAALIAALAATTDAAS